MRMSVTDTHPDLPAQTATFQHLDEPPTAPSGTPARGNDTNGKTIPDDLRVGQAIVGGPPSPSSRGRDPVAHGIRSPIQPGWFDKLEAFISKLSVRDNFWNSVCSLLWLPLAFWSGIRLKQEPEP